MTHSKKFMTGLVLLITNFIVGKIAIPFFAIDARWGLAIYIFSWLMLLAGLYLCGREGLDYARIYYYHLKQNLKKNTVKSLHAIKSLRPDMNKSK